MKELLRAVEAKNGMKKLVNFVVKSVDLNELSSQKNLLQTFVDELLKD